MWPGSRPGVQDVRRVPGPPSSLPATKCVCDRGAGRPTPHTSNGRPGWRPCRLADADGRTSPFQRRGGKKVSDTPRQTPTTRRRHAGWVSDTFFPPLTGGQVRLCGGSLPLTRRRGDAETRRFGLSASPCLRVPASAREQPPFPEGKHPAGSTQPFPVQRRGRPRGRRLERNTRNHGGVRRGPHPC